MSPHVVQETVEKAKIVRQKVFDFFEQLLSAPVPQVRGGQKAVCARVQLVLQWLNVVSCVHRTVWLGKSSVVTERADFKVVIGMFKLFRVFRDSDFRLCHGFSCMCVS